MDHFPLFSGHLAPLIDSLEVSERVTYDDKGYHDFPLRAGFDEDEVSDGLFLGQVDSLKHQPDEYAALIQSWFYWALIHECTGEAVDRSEFLALNREERKTLNTANLENKMVSWAVRLETMDKDTALQHIRHANDILGRTVFLLTVLSQRRERPEKIGGNSTNMEYWERYGAEIFPLDLELAIGALCFAIGHAMNTISHELELDPSSDVGDTRERSSWYTPPLLTNLLKLYNFCESDMVHFNNDEYGFVLSCMAISLSDLSRPGDHSACTVDRCEADNIKPEAYVRSHVQDVCTCPSVMYENTWNSMLEIIEQGNVPLIRVKMLPPALETGQDPQLEVFAASPGVDYVAFSHVWADGRGNQEGNDMFRCQWQWLQRCAQLCVPPSACTDDSPPIDESMPFWIDTFCVPRGEGQRVLELRLKSITMMSSIYHSARYVVVLDSALENLGRVSVLEFALRLKFCTWSHRVWTLHEGAVARDVRIRTADGLVSVVGLLNQIARAKYPARDDTGWHILYSIEQEYVFATLPTCIMVTQSDRSESAMLEFSWRELNKRTTTFENDRYLVLGIMNRLPPQTLIALGRQKLDDTNLQAAAKAKLKAFLLALKVIPQSVIFSLDPRFDEPGMRWAPGVIGGEMPQERNTTCAYIDVVNERGAIVRYNGWRLLSSLHDAKQSIFVRIETRATGQQLSQAFHLTVWPTDAKRKSMSSICDLVSPETTLAIVLDELPEEGSTYTEFRRALLVEDCGVIPVATRHETARVAQTAILARYIAVLRVMSTSSDRETNKTIQVGWVEKGHEQLWCIG